MIDDESFWDYERWAGQKLRDRGKKKGVGRALAALQGGFPEVRAVNITEKCGMLKLCQRKHTGPATAASNSCQVLLSYTQTHVSAHMHTRVAQNSSRS